jgi:hypothetical protein
MTTLLLILSLQPFFLPLVPNTAQDKTRRAGADAVFSRL